MTIDKYKHIVVSAIIAVALNLILPWWVAVSVASTREFP